MPLSQLAAVAELVYDRLPVTVIRFDRDYRFLFVNRRYAEQVGQPAAELIGRTFADLTIPVPEGSRRAFGLAAGRAFAGEPDECSFDIGPPTAVRTVHALFLPEFDPAGRVASVLSVGTDVTAFREAEAARREAAGLFHTFMDANPAVAWMKDADGRYVYLSESYRRQLGADAGWLGKTDHDVWPAAEAEQFRANDRRVLAGGAAEQMTETAAAADGTTRTWLSVKFPFTDAAGRRFVGGLGIELTGQLRAEAEKRAAEEQRKHEKQILHAQKLESLGVLAGGIAHDFNNLLTGILGYASLARLELQATGHPAAAHLEHIEKGAVRAADLCGQMLAYAGKGQVAVQPTDLNRLVQEMASLLAMTISKKAVLRFDLARDLPAVSGDPTQLRQVAMNLITNASDAIGDRSGLIGVATGTIDADAVYLADIGAADLPPRRYVTLEVSDNGCGMSEETKARIFEPFFTTKFTGRGLGLSAVAGIVRSHGGAIKVYSQAGKGTTFKVLLPATAAAAPPDTPPPALRAAFGRGRAVLVVDDEEAVRVLIRKVLTAAGFEAELAADGRAGVAAFAARPHHFALALVDLTMPHLGGADVFRELRAVRKDVSVVLMSGFAEADATAGFAGKGLAGFLRKPFTVPDLLAAVRAAVGA
jgi:two-component system cell cycle sensor histidine kinase/response regulator CckA